MSENTDTKPTPATPIVRPVAKEAFEKMEQKLPANFKPMGESQETRALETLIADLNAARPGQVGKLPPTPGDYSAPLAPSGTTITASDPALEGATGAPLPTPQVQPAAGSTPGTGPSPVPGPGNPAPFQAVTIELGPQGAQGPQHPTGPAGFQPVKTNNFKRVFLTGRSGAGTSYVARQVAQARGVLIYDLRDVAARFLAATVMGKTPPPTLPIANHQHNGLIIVTGVDDFDTFKQLVEMGFEHYHVCCSSQVLPQRPNRRVGHNEDMAINFDQQTAQAVRQTGPNKKIVWNESTSPLPPRLMSVQQFVTEMQARNQ